jgi:hypothetical protein
MKNMGTSTPQIYLGYDSTKPIDIDENEEMERLLLLRHRETLIRGMGKTRNNFNKKIINCI